MELYVIEGAPETAEEAIGLAYQRLREAGAVKESFLEGCLQREKEYPTGLPTEIPVAIPHTDTRHVESPALCAVRLASPVTFRCMADPDETVEAQYIIVMALKEAGDQLDTLKQLMGIVQNRELLEGWRDIPLEEMRAQMEEEISRIEP